MSDKRKVRQKTTNFADEGEYEYLVHHFSIKVSTRTWTLFRWNGLRMNIEGRHEKVKGSVASE